MTTLTSFTLFPSFPTEIRLLIWHFSLKPRFIYSPAHLISDEISRPPLLFTNKESSQVLLSLYSKVTHPYHPGRIFLVDLEDDNFNELVLLGVNSTIGLQACDKARSMKKAAISTGSTCLIYTFAITVARVLKFHPNIEKLVIFIMTSRVECPLEPEHGLEPDQRDDFLRFLKTVVGPEAWGKKENIELYQKHRGEPNSERKLKILFNIEHMVVKWDWDQHVEVDLETVEGVPEKELEELWKRWIRNR